MKTIKLIVMMMLFAHHIFAQAPVPAIGISRTNVCPGFAVTFTDQSTNNPTSWQWTFEGGTPSNSNAQNPPNVVFNNSGRYDITLQVTNASGSNTITFTDTVTIQDCNISSGIYRIPYVDGTDVSVGRDHLTHSPAPIRIDLNGFGGSGGPYQIVAAADGWIRAIVDNFSGCCSGAGSCSDCNNYVWIEHPNGEWTKYTHFQTGSVTATGLVKDSFICAGTYLGLEGDVGASSGGGRAAVACDGNIPLQNTLDSLNAINIGNGQDSIRCGIHLHFEVGIPDDISDPFDTLGGFLNGQNLIPVICDVPGNIFIDGQTYVAGPCDYGSCVDDLLLQNQNFGVGDIGVFQADNEIIADNNFDVNVSGNVLMSAGDRVVLGPGFTALTDSYFRARIGDCNKSPGAVCNAGLRVNVTASDISNVGNRITETGLVTYPNPVNEVLNIVYMIGETSVVNLKVVNIYGQEMMRLDENITREAGTVHNLKMETGDMPPGPYFCILQSGGTIKVSRFVKVH